MGFLDALATLGVTGGGYYKTDREIMANESMRRRGQTEDIALREAIRKDELAQATREAMSRVPTRAAMKGLPALPEHQSEPYDEEYRPAQVGVDSQESPNIVAQARAKMEAELKGGDLEAAEKTRKVLDGIEREGYNKLIAGMADGRGIDQLAKEFNAIGDRRITGGSTDGKTYKITFEDGTSQEYSRDDMRRLAVDHKLITKPDQKLVPPGYSLTENGKPVYTNEGKPAAVRAAEVRAGAPKAAPKPRNFTAIDQELRRLATAHFTSKDEVTGATNVDNESKEEALAEAGKLVRANPDMPPAEALRTAAEGVSNRKQIRTQAIDEVTKLADGLSFEDETKRQEWINSTARRRAKSRIDRESAPPAAAPADAPASEGLVDQPKIVKPVVQHKGQTMTFTGKYSRDGKPIYTNGKGDRFTMEK